MLEFFQDVYVPKEVSRSFVGYADRVSNGTQVSNVRSVHLVEGIVRVRAEISVWVMSQISNLEESRY